VRGEREKREEGRGRYFIGFFEGLSFFDAGVSQVSPGKVISHQPVPNLRRISSYRTYVDHSISKFYKCPSL
jgi:hypothetical protein